MNRLILIYFIFISFLSCKEKNEEQPIVVGERTICEFNKKSHDFGNVVQGDVLETTFVVKNIGDNPLNLIRVKPSCGCTTPHYTKEPILPGKTGEIQVKIKTDKFQGKINKSVIVSSNTTPIKNHLNIQATVNKK